MIVDVINIMKTQKDVNSNNKTKMPPPPLFASVSEKRGYK